MHGSRFLSGLLAATFLLSYAQPIFATTTTSPVDSFCAISVPGYTTTRLTNNHRYNTSVVPLEDGKAAWLELGEGGAGPGKLVYFDGISQRVLSEHVDIDNGRAGIVGAGASKLAWEENTGGSRLDIFFFDGTRVTRLTSPSSDVTNRGVSVDASGKVAWVRTISDPVSGSLPTQLYGESRVMLWDGTSTRAISEANRSASNNGVFYRTDFSNGVLTWIATEASHAHANQSEDRYSVYLYRDGTVRSHVLPDLPGGNYFFNYAATDAGIIYEPKPTSDADAGLYRSYSWAMNTTTDITHFSPGSDASFVSKANRFGASVFSPDRTYLWTGSELRETSRLKPSQYNAHLNTSDIKSDGSSVLYAAYTNNSPVLSQIFKYDIASNTLSQLTNTSGSWGASYAWFGRNGEIYWNVYSSDTYQPTDICVARLSSASTPAPVPMPAEPTPDEPLLSTEANCSQEAVDSYSNSINEAAQTLKRSSLAAFDTQVGYRLGAQLNKRRIGTVRTSLTRAKVVFERALDGFINAQTGSLVIRARNNRTTSSPVVDLTRFNSAWLSANRSLLLYANATDKVMINRVLSRTKIEIINQYKAANQQSFSSLQEERDACVDQSS